MASITATKVTAIIQLNMYCESFVFKNLSYFILFNLSLVGNFQLDVIIKEIYTSFTFFNMRYSAYRHNCIKGRVDVLLKKTKKESQGFIYKRSSLDKGILSKTCSTLSIDCR